MSTSCEWSILEKLLLTQAVYKYGENMWFQVARVLKQHGLIQPQQRQSDFFSQKNCQFQYYLLVENLEAEKQVYRNNDLKNDMPVVVRIARQLYLQRIEEVKEGLRKDEESFGQLAEEIESIKSGKWDQTLSAGGSDKIPNDADLPSEEEEIVRGEPKETNSSDSAVSNEITSNTTTENKIVESVAQLENRMKRTSSETAIASGSSLKRCRLEETSSESSEDQVILTAISNGNTPKIDASAIFSPDVVASSEKMTQEEELRTMHTYTPNLQESNITPITFSKSFPNPPQLNNIIPIVDPVTTDTVPVTDTTPNSPEAVNNFTMVTEAIHMINMSNRVTMTKEPTKRFETTAEPITVRIDTETKDTSRDMESQKMGTESITNTNDQVSPMEEIIKDSTEKTLINEKLPKIIIPETSTSSYQRTYYDQSASPISKINMMTPDDEYYTGSETATPTSTSAIEKRRLNPNHTNDQRQKAWQKNINLLWQEIANHKNGTMFMNPIKKSYAPLYDKVVKQPLYLKTIKNRVRDGIVKTTAEFERDVVLMLTNSLMYNKEGTEMYLMALEMLDDVREQIRLFKSADGYSVSLWENDSQQL